MRGDHGCAYVLTTFRDAGLDGAADGTAWTWMVGSELGLSSEVPT